MIVDSLVFSFLLWLSASGNTRALRCIDFLPYRSSSDKCFASSALIGAFKKRGVETMTTRSVSRYEYCLMMSCILQKKSDRGEALMRELGLTKPHIISTRQRMEISV